MNEGNACRVSEGERVVNEREAEVNRHDRTLPATHATYLSVHTYLWKLARCTGWLPFLIDETRFPAPTPDIRRVHRHSNTQWILPGSWLHSFRRGNLHWCSVSPCYDIDRRNLIKIRRNFIVAINIGSWEVR